MKVQTKEGIADVDILQVTPENYIVPDNERNSFHVIIEVVKFDSNTGRRLSRPRLQKFGAKAFAQARRVLEMQGYTVKVLYDPTGYIKEMEAERQKSAAQRKKEADIKRQQEIDAAVSAALAEQAKKTSEIVEKAVAEALAKRDQETRSNRKKQTNN